MVQLANHFGLPEILRDKMFKIIGISTYQFEHGNSTCFTLEGVADTKISLTIESDAGRETAAFAYSISRSTVEELFELDEFSTVFDSEDAVTLNLQNDAGLPEWVASQYRQEIKGERGYFYDEDYRDSEVPAYEGAGEPLEYYLLVSDDESRGVEIEVFPGGETEVSLTLYCELEMISGLWPAGQAPGK